LAWRAGGFGRLPTSDKALVKCSLDLYIDG
jgi:hypothetical protein